MLFYDSVAQRDLPLKEVLVLLNIQEEENADFKILYEKLKPHWEKLRDFKGRITQSPQILKAFLEYVELMHF